VRHATSDKPSHPALPVDVDPEVEVVCAVDVVDAVPAPPLPSKATMPPQPLAEAAIASSVLETRTSPIDTVDAATFTS